MDVCVESENAKVNEALTIVEDNVSGINPKKRRGTSLDNGEKAKKDDVNGRMDRIDRETPQRGRQEACANFCKHICKNCGDGRHLVAACKKTFPCCPNCKAAGLPDDHSALHKDCPIYKKTMTKTKKRSALDAVCVIKGIKLNVCECDPVKLSTFV